MESFISWANQNQGLIAILIFFIGIIIGLIKWCFDIKNKNPTDITINTVSVSRYTQEIAEYGGQGIVGILGTYTFTHPCILDKCSLETNTLPYGSNCILELRLNGTTGINLLFEPLQITNTDNINNGTIFVTTSRFKKRNLEEGDYIVAYLSEVGKECPVLNPVCYIDFHRSY